jgi:hypothetical protein
MKNFSKVPWSIGQIKKSHLRKNFGHSLRVNYQVLKIDGQFRFPYSGAVLGYGFKLFDA